MFFVKKDIHKLLSVMIPILVAQVSTAGVTFINTTMAGHAGADDLAGVSVGAGLFYPLLASIIGLLMAGTPPHGPAYREKKTGTPFPSS
jgi:MATE family multidrug resistance protein